MATMTTPKSVRIHVNDDALKMGVQGRSLGERGEVDQSSNASFDEDGEDSRDPFCVVESIMGVNRMLEKQIEALRLRVNVEAKHHAIEKSKIVGEKDAIISKKTATIEELKEGILQRDDKINALKMEAANKSNIIENKSLEIDKLKELIKVAEDYTNRLHNHSENVKGRRGYMNKDDLAKFEKDELNKLREELNMLKQKVVALEKELANAREVIEKQGSKISQLDSEKAGLSLKFKDQLEKASRAMKLEVERMREVMKNQWEEMRNLREQNQDIHDDVKMIRTLLVDQVTVQNNSPAPGDGKPKNSSSQNTPDKDLLLSEFDNQTEATPGASGEHNKDFDVRNPQDSTRRVDAKARIPVNRPTLSKTPRLATSTKNNNGGKTTSSLRSSSVLSGRNRQSNDANNLPPIQNVQRSPTVATSGEAATSRGTRRPCGINSAKQGLGATKKK